MTIGQKIESALAWALIALIAALLVGLIGGCVETLSPAATAAIGQLRDQAAIDRQKAKAAADALAADAAAKPTIHPLEFQNLIISEVRGPLILVGSIATLAFFIGVGLIVAAMFASVLGAMLKSIGLLVAPIAGCVAGGAWGTLWFLPFAPWILGGCVSLALVLFLVQLGRAHWNVAALFGLHAANSVSINAVAAGLPPTPMDVPIVVPAKAVATAIPAPAPSQLPPLYMDIPNPPKPADRTLGI